MSDNVAYVTTMVDRITPVPTPQDIAGVEAETGVRDRAAVVTEPFTEWVISGEFAAGRPGWEDAGATFTTDVAPFEQRKLWLLNGAPLDARVRRLDPGSRDRGGRHARRDLRRVAPGMVGGGVQASDPARRRQRRLRAALTERFANSRMRHRLDQIAWDGSQKLPSGCFPCSAASTRPAGCRPAHPAARRLGV